MKKTQVVYGKLCFKNRAVFVDDFINKVIITNNDYRCFVDFHHICDGIDCYCVLMVQRIDLMPLTTWFWVCGDCE